MSQPYDLAAPLLAGGGLRIVILVVVVGIGTTAWLLLRGYRK
ncbi:hypothetical protein [Streptomyces sp. MUSC 14]|nr:hypothetical protein [Streptomyces sp. MUSC 14]